MRLKTIFKSFVHAFQGIFFSLKTQRNFRIHTIIAVLVVIAGVLIKVTINEWLAITLCIGMVMSAELFNTAIEQFADKLHPEQDIKIGRVKDLAAAAVLITAVTSLAIAFLIFSSHF